MSSNTTPASLARSFARTQRLALATLGCEGREEIVRIALAGDGSILLRNDVPIVAKPFRVTRLLLGTRRCYVSLEGQVAPHRDDFDAERLRTLHHGVELRFRLEPDVVVWSCVDHGPHAFLAAEWLIDALPSEAAASELVEHMNRAHSTLLEALVREFSELDGAGARLASIDPDGLLIDALSRLLHIPFDRVCPTAEDVGQAIVRLVRNVAWMDTQASDSALFSSASRFMLEGAASPSSAESR